jgi:predicted anti-sigma-YlaC factor YlaD
MSESEDELLDAVWFALATVVGVGLAANIPVLLRVWWPSAIVVTIVAFFLAFAAHPKFGVVRVSRLLIQENVIGRRLLLFVLCAIALATLAIYPLLNVQTPGAGSDRDDALVMSHSSSACRSRSSTYWSYRTSLGSRSWRWQSYVLRSTSRSLLPWSWSPSRLHRSMIR